MNHDGERQGKRADQVEFSLLVLVCLCWLGVMGTVGFLVGAGVAVLVK